MAETTPDIQGLAEIMSFGPEWIVFRQFRILQIRLMLELQAKIERLAIADPEGELEKTVDKYNSRLAVMMQLATARKPGKAALVDLRQWARECRQTKRNYANFLKNKEFIESDLIAPMLEAQPPDLITKTVEAMAKRLISKVAKDDAVGVVYTYSGETVGKIARVVVLVLAATLLLVPIVILYFVRSGFWPLLVLILWTILFTALIALVTSARNTDVMMAAAAYAAVMVVFVGR